MWFEELDSHWRRGKRGENDRKGKIQKKKERYGTERMGKNTHEINICMVTAFSTSDHAPHVH